MKNKEMILIKMEVLTLMIFANDAEIAGTFNAMKKFSGATELNARLLVLQDVNKALRDKLREAASPLECMVRPAER